MIPQINKLSNIPQSRSMRSILRSLPERICYDYTDDVKEDVQCLPEIGLLALHYIICKHIQVLTKKQMLTKETANNLGKYVEGLSRLHKGLFWRIFNWSNADISAMWYSWKKKHMDLILEALVCIPKAVRGEWKDNQQWIRDHKETYMARIYNLDTVCDYKVKIGCFGLRRQAYTNNYPAPLDVMKKEASAVFA